MQGTTDAVSDKKKVKNSLMAEKVSRGGLIGVLGRAVSKRLKPGAGGGAKQQLGEAQLRQRRKESICRATQNTRLSCLSDEMLMDHTQVNNTPHHRHHHRRCHHTFVQND